MESSIAHLIDEQQRNIDGFAIGRVLPSRVQRTVGPFIFFDHIGPAALAPGHGLDVRPHPHIHLSTVTYLFEGEILHRDSLGCVQSIQPGAINWMTAGRGIVHSERSPPAERAAGPKMHGLQLWVASPESHEDIAPSFSHHAEGELPALTFAGGHGKLLAGSAYGLVAPVPVQSPLCYIELHLEAGARVELPDLHERGLYLLSGELEVDHQRLGPQKLAVLTPGATPNIVATQPTHLMILGGEPIGERYIFWNFVSSKKEAIVEATRAWKAGEFPRVPDEHDFIPLEAEPHFA